MRSISTPTAQSPITATIPWCKTAGLGMTMFRYRIWIQRAPRCRTYGMTGLDLWSLTTRVSCLLQSSLRQDISPYPKANWYIVDGLRVDTVRHVQKDFWPGYNKAAGVYCVGEVFDGDADYTCPYQEVMDGVLNYPMCDPACPWNLPDTQRKLKAN